MGRNSKSPTALILVFTVALLFSVFPAPSAIAESDSPSINITVDGIMYWSTDNIDVGLNWTDFSADSNNSVSVEIRSTVSGEVLDSTLLPVVNFANSSGQMQLGSFGLHKSSTGTHERILAVTITSLGGELIAEGSAPFSVFQPPVDLGIENIIAFGDSLSDQGNIEDWITPLEVPYWEGRFSNGPIWLDHIAAEYGVNLSEGARDITGLNRAWGGAQAGPGFAGTAIPNIATQIEDFLKYHTIPENTTAFVWAGGNNFISGEEDTLLVAQYMVEHVQSLADAGVVRIVVLNLPPLESTPLYSDDSAEEREVLADRIEEYNTIFEQEIRTAELSIDVPIHILDAHHYFGIMAALPSSYGFEDVVTPVCSDSPNSEICDVNSTIADDIDSHLFLDGVHPTARGHELIAKFVLENFAGIDVDGDGVDIYLDACPNTITASSVDAEGCSSAERDSDSDVIPDSLDTCIDTQQGAEVDLGGCSDAQRDGDGDGVSDAEDDCLATSDGLVVDDLGCADSERDSDADGVMDDVDYAPLDPNVTEQPKQGEATPALGLVDTIAILLLSVFWLRSRD